MLITAARILTGNLGEVIDDGAVLMSGETIVAAGPRTHIEDQAQSNEPRLDFPGATVMAGLIDAHTHLCFDAGREPVETLLASSDDDLADAMRIRAERFLAAGVTTVRDLGDRGGLALRLAREIDRGTTAGPRILSAGAPVTPVGGHCHFLGGEVNGPGEIRALVQRNASAGAKVIKVMETGGALTKGGKPSWENQFTLDDLKVLVQEARQVGLPVAAHAHGAEGIADAVEAGVDTLEHCTWMTPGRDIGLREDVLAAIVAKNIAVCPTITADWRQLPLFFGEELAQKMFDAVQRMAAVGVRLITGTDAGVQRAQPGGLAASLTFYQHLGIPAERILQMATTQTAQALGLGDETGKIAAGYRADVIVLDGNPLENLDALRAVKAVFAKGQRYQPQA
ncbi:amidohydrolase family protein [Streptomyces roseoverticillatus]|uniref:amidohydrolase family protein n=1 Tax=Streptomyces roseoverticillatus TaxID=66429 RepID=UPI00340126FF